MIGSGAATFQSADGATAAFSTLQSAAMGGYGAPIVGGIAQGASVVGAGVAQLFKKIGTGKLRAVTREEEEEAAIDGPTLNAATGGGVAG